MTSYKILVDLALVNHLSAGIKGSGQGILNILNFQVEARVIILESNLDQSFFGKLLGKSKKAIVKKVNDIHREGALPTGNH
jgi:hypothetical protein